MNIHRVVIGDEHASFRADLAAVLSERFEIDELIQASDFPHTMAAIARAPRTTMVTVNTKLPAMDGAIGLRRLRTDYPSLLVVVVAESSGRDMVLDALCAGVHGFIVRTTPVDEMTHAFETVLSGHIYVPPLASDDKVKTSASAMVTPISGVVLTDRQLDVLKLVAAGRSNKEIARSLFISEGTVKVHLTAVFRALGVHNRVSAAAALPTFPAKVHSPPVPDVRP